MRTRIWHSDWKPRWLIRYVSAALLSFMDKQVNDSQRARQQEEADLLGRYINAYKPNGCNVKRGG